MYIAVAELTLHCVHILPVFLHKTCRNRLLIEIAIDEKMKRKGIKSL